MLNLNGECVFDNRRGGNGGDLVTRQNRVILHLRKGRNLLAFRLAGGSLRGCWLSVGRDLSTAEAGQKVRSCTSTTSIYRGPVLLAYDPRHNPTDHAMLPVFDARNLKLRTLRP